MYFHDLAGTIVLCHGFLGFNSFGPLDYFKGVRDELERRGCRVIVPKVPETGSIDERAAVLKREIEGLLPGVPSSSRRGGGVLPAVHIIGHSMGGLDARRLVHMKDLGFRVLSITTVNTPHHGSPVAELSNTMGFMSRQACKSIQRLIGGSGRAMEDLRPKNMAAFNARYKDRPDVRYFSVSSQFRPAINHLFFMTHKIIRASEGRDAKRYPAAYGPNDGMVAVTSARWGKHLDVVHAETSHLGVIGWGFWIGGLAGEADYDAKTELYPALVENVALNVEGKHRR